MKTIIIFHESDFDGKCSGAIAKIKFPDATLYGWEYGGSIDWNLIDQFERVIMADVSFPDLNDMIRLDENHEFLWIDHHISAIEKYEHLNILGIQRVEDHNGRKTGACELTWEYFFRNEDVPLAVKLLAEYDVWNHEDKRCLPFQYGMRNADIATGALQWWKEIFLGKEAFGNILKTGQICHEFEISSNKFKAKSAFPVKFKGYNCIAINSTPCNSTVFDSVNGDDYDFMIVMNYNGEKEKPWRISMYTSTIVNVGQIAVELGGGGHCGASGFECSTQKMIELGLL